MQKILFLLFLTTNAFAQLNTQIPYPQGGLLGKKNAVEVSYNYNDPTYDLAPYQMRVGGKFDGIFLGLGWHNRRQYDFPYTSQTLNSLAVDLGYDWKWKSGLGLNTMLMYTFSMPTPEPKITPYTFTTLNENVSMLSTQLYYEAQVGQFIMKPFLGGRVALSNGKDAYSNLKDDTLQGVGGGTQDSTRILVERNANNLGFSADLGLVIAIEFDEFRVGLIPMIRTTNNNYPTWGIQAAAAYNFSEK